MSLFKKKLLMSLISSISMLTACGWGSADELFPPEVSARSLRGWGWDPPKEAPFGPLTKEEALTTLIAKFNTAYCNRGTLEVKAEYLATFEELVKIGEASEDIGVLEKISEAFFDIPSFKYGGGSAFDNAYYTPRLETSEQKERALPILKKTLLGSKEHRFSFEYHSYEGGACLDSREAQLTFYRKVITEAIDTLPIYFIAVKELRKAGEGEEKIEAERRYNAMGEDLNHPYNFSILSEMVARDSLSREQKVEIQFKFRQIVTNMDHPHAGSAAAYLTSKQYSWELEGIDAGLKFYVQSLQKMSFINPYSFRVKSAHEAAERWKHLSPRIAEKILRILSKKGA